MDFAAKAMRLYKVNQNILTNLKRELNNAGVQLLFRPVVSSLTLVPVAFLAVVCVPQNLPCREKKKKNAEVKPPQLHDVIVYSGMFAASMEFRFILKLSICTSRDSKRFITRPRTNK